MLMVLSRRSSPLLRGNEPFLADNATDEDDESLLDLSNSLQHARLLSIDQVPAWYAQNEYIRTGYRPVMYSVQRCLQSLGYLHNESLNIYTHLIPAILTVIGNLVLNIYFTASFPAASRTDQLVFHVYLTTSTICFAISSSYHTLLCHSEHYADLWVRLDYVAIVFQILGSFLSGIYVGFYCEPALQKLYWTMVGLKGSEPPTEPR